MLVAAVLVLVAVSSALPVQAQTEDCSRAGLSKRAREACEQKNQNARAIETDCAPENGAPLSQHNCGIVKYLLLFINVLSSIVGIVIVIMIIIGGIQYSTAADNPQAAVEAKKRIANAILALLLFIFMFSFLQWVVPGGIF